MTNFEKYKNEIKNVAFTIADGKITMCSGTQCSNCLFRERYPCLEARWEWLKEEYKEYEDPKPKRTIDVDEFAAYLESEIENLEGLEQSDADNGDYASAIEHHGYANAFHELLGLITLDNPPEWVKIEEE